MLWTVYFEEKIQPCSKLRNSKKGLNFALVVELALLNFTYSSKIVTARPHNAVWPEYTTVQSSGPWFKLCDFLPQYAL